MGHENENNNGPKLIELEVAVVIALLLVIILKEDNDRK